ncbi:MAG: sel1 repeat family protein [Thermoguttaceae bacterium]|nr:sel1 repeat family protein [Thermoguttaceae bacterium]MBQ3348787.1 sel1 repeat family protein [Thermoguttaceae bacterium]
MTIKKTTLKKRTTKTRRSPNNRILLLGILFVVCCFFCVSFSSFVGSPEYEAQVLFEQGDEYFKDEKFDKALECWKQAAEKGYAEANAAIGMLYTERIFLGKVDYKTAFEWYRKGAELGDVKAYGLISGCYQQGHGVPQNEKEALKWRIKAAEKGDVISQYILGAWYETGQIVPKDKSKAREWYQKAAEKGDEAAQERLKELQ